MLRVVAMLRQRGGRELLFLVSAWLQIHRSDMFDSVAVLVFRLASFSSIAERMNLKYVRSIMRRLVPV